MMKCWKFVTKAWIFGAVFLVVTIWAGCVVYFKMEDRAGARIWAETLAMLEAEGETVDFDALLPELVPDEENFGALDCLKGIGIGAVGYGGVEKREANRKKRWLNEMRERIFEKDEDEEWPMLWLKQFDGSDEIDLAEWAALIRRGNSGEVGRQILDGLEELEGTFDQLESGLGREYAQLSPPIRKWDGTDESQFSSGAHLRPLQRLAEMLALRAYAGLAGAGEPGVAGRAIHCQLRISEVCAGGGSISERLTQMKLVRLALATIWTGLGERKFSAGELEQLQVRLAGLGLMASAADGLRLDLAKMVGFMLAKKETGETRRGFSVMGETEFGIKGLIMNSFILDGWIDHNLALLVECYRQYYLAPLEMGEPLVEARCRAAPLENGVPRKVGNVEITWVAGPYNFFVRMALPAGRRYLRVCSETQTRVDLAIVACALERFYLAGGGYPESLGAMVPEFLGEIPVSLMDHGALGYELTEDGRYFLSAPGWEEGEVIGWRY